ncbi:MAG: hypothetical protein ACRCZD_12295, partial [Phycicoccus sp.]
MSQDQALDFSSGSIETDNPFSGAPSETDFAVGDTSLSGVDQETSSSNDMSFTGVTGDTGVDFSGDKSYGDGSAFTEAASYSILQTVALDACSAGQSQIGRQMTTGYTDTALDWLTDTLNSVLAAMQGVFKEFGDVANLLRQVWSSGSGSDAMKEVSGVLTLAGLDEAQQVVDINDKIKEISAGFRRIKQEINALHKSGDIYCAAVMCIPGGQGAAVSAANVVTQITNGLAFQIAAIAQDVAQLIGMVSDLFGGDSGSQTSTDDSSVDDGTEDSTDDSSTDDGTEGQADIEEFDDGGAGDDLADDTGDDSTDDQYGADDSSTDTEDQADIEEFDDGGAGDDLADDTGDDSTDDQYGADDSSTDTEDQADIEEFDDGGAGQDLTEDSTADSSTEGQDDIEEFDPGSGTGGGGDSGSGGGGLDTGTGGGSGGGGLDTGTGTGGGTGSGSTGGGSGSDQGSSSGTPEIKPFDPGTGGGSGGGGLDTGTGGGSGGGGLDTGTGTGTGGGTGSGSTGGGSGSDQGSSSGTPEIKPFDPGTGGGSGGGGLDTGTGGGSGGGGLDTGTGGGGADTGPAGSETAKTASIPAFDPGTGMGTGGGPGSSGAGGQSGIPELSSEAPEGVEMAEDGTLLGSDGAPLAKGPGDTSVAPDGTLLGSDGTPLQHTAEGWENPLTGEKFDENGNLVENASTGAGEVAAAEAGTLPDGVHVDPETGELVGDDGEELPRDPKTDLPMVDGTLLDPLTGQELALDPETQLPVDPTTGALIDPETG